MNGRRGSRPKATVGEPPRAAAVAGRLSETVSKFTTSVSNDVLTAFSIPALLIVVHFLIRPFVEGWYRLGYVRYTAARTAPAHSVAPDPFAAHVLWWHELTRFTHALVHASSNYHVHVLGNALLIGSAAWTLLVLLDRLGRRQWFVFLYWELVVVGPLVGSYSFDLFGTTPRGYGASTIGYAFLGTLLLVGLAALLDSVGHLLWTRRDRAAVSSGRLSHERYDPTRSFVLVCLLLAFVTVVIAVDFAEGSPAMPVHQAGVGFGALAGGAVSLVRCCSPDTGGPNTHEQRRHSDDSDPVSATSRYE